MSAQLPPHHQIPLSKPINPDYEFDINKGMYSEREEPEYYRLNSATTETKFKLRFGRDYHVDIAIKHTLSPQVTNEQEVIKQAFQILTSELSQKHTGISVNEDVLGGMPRLEGLRVSVPNVLTHLYHLGSIDAVVAEFEQRISKEQVREAIAYAHDFMEMACDPSEDDD